MNINCLALLKVAFLYFLKLFYYFRKLIRITLLQLDEQNK